MISGELLAILAREAEVQRAIAQMYRDNPDPFATGKTTAEAAAAIDLAERLAADYELLVRVAKLMSHSEVAAAVIADLLGETPDAESLPDGGQLEMTRAEVAAELAIDRIGGEVLRAEDDDVREHAPPFVIHAITPGGLTPACGGDKGVSTDYPGDVTCPAPACQQLATAEGVDQ